MRYIAEHIGTQLLNARERLGLTQRAFAERAGTTQSRISKIENGDVDLRVSSLIDLARNLELEFMLVPRQYVPAVKAIISRQILSSEEVSLRAAVTRLQQQASQLAESFPDNPYLGSLTRTTKELSNLRLRTADLTTIKKASDVLRLIEKTPALINTIRQTSEDLRNLRNARAHDLASKMDEPRPVYRLDEDDDG